MDEEQEIYFDDEIIDAEISDGSDNEDAKILDDSENEEDDSENEEDEEDDVDDEDDEEKKYHASCDRGNKRKLHEKILRTGSDRHPNFKLSNFEYANAIKAVAKEIENGAIAPKCAGNLTGITRSEIIAQKIVDSISRNDKYTEIKKNLNFPTIFIDREGPSYIDRFRLEEMIDYSKMDRKGQHNNYYNSEELIEIMSEVL